MCGGWHRRLNPEPCVNYKCPHNLFWDALNLDREKVRITPKTLEIRNCCCLITRPWTSEEINEAWGLATESVTRSEEAAWKKIQRKTRLGHRCQSQQGVNPTVKPNTPSN